MNEQDSLAIVRRGYEAFQAGDMTALMELLADDVEWHTPDVAGVAFSGKRHGKAGVADYFHLLGEAEEFIVFEPREFIAQGERVAVLGRSHLRVKETGRMVDSAWVHIFTLRNGRVTQFLELYDTAALEHAHQQVASA